MKRTPMARGKGFQRAVPPRPPKQVHDFTAPKREQRGQILRMDDGRARLSVPVPKPEACKPGKRTPNAAEREWMDAITAIGCIACLIDGHPGTPGAVHHLLRGGQRIGHMHTICLCDPGHHQNGAQFGKVSRHPWKARFEAKYGTEEELLAATLALVAKG
jgi:hypothetical protein